VKNENQKLGLRIKDNEQQMAGIIGEEPSIKLGTEYFNCLDDWGYKQVRGL